MSKTLDLSGSASDRTAKPYRFPSFLPTPRSRRSRRSSSEEGAAIMTDEQQAAFDKHVGEGVTRDGRAR